MREKEPQRVAQLERTWTAWAKRCNVLPLNPGRLLNERRKKERAAKEAEKKKAAAAKKKAEAQERKAEAQKK